VNWKNIALNEESDYELLAEEELETLMQA